MGSVDFFILKKQPMVQQISKAASTWIHLFVVVLNLKGDNITFQWSLYCDFIQVFDKTLYAYKVLA